MAIKYLNNVDLNQNELQYVVIQNLSVAPSISRNGQIYYDTVTSELQLKTPAGWVPIASNSFNPSDYDLDQFTNLGIDPFAHISDIPVYQDFIEDSITNGVITKAPTENAVYDALQLKQDSLVGTGFVKSTAGIITYDTNSYYLASNPNAFISLGALSSNAIGLNYNNTTGVFSFSTGYSIPTTASQTNWDNAYTYRLLSVTTNGTSGTATLANNILNIPQYSGSTTALITADLDLGGIQKQQEIPIGTDLQEFVTLLLKKTFYPTLIAPTFALANNSGGIKEVGTSSSFTLTFTFIRGNILGALVAGVWDPATSQGSRAGAATSYTINGITGPANTVSVSPTIIPNTNTFNATVSYAAGIQPLDSLGANFNSPYPAGTSAIQQTTVQGIYPYFWYKSSSPITPADMQAAIANGQATKEVSSSTGTITINFSATGQYLAVAYPATSTTKTKWYVTALNNGTIPGGVFGSEATLSCTSPPSPTILWSNVPYKIHTTAGLITESLPIELRNS